MFIERIPSIRVKCIFFTLDIIINQRSTVTIFEYFTTYKTLDINDRIFIKPDLKVISRLCSIQLRLSGKIKIDKIFDEKVFIGIDYESLIRNFKSIYFYDRDYIKIFFDSAYNFYFLTYICIEIDGRTFETNLFSFLDSNCMSIVGKLIIDKNPSGKCECSSQSIHILLRSLTKPCSYSRDKLYKNIYPYKDKDSPKNNFCIYCFFLLQISYIHKDR